MYFMGKVCDILKANTDKKGKMEMEKNRGRDIIAFIVEFTHKAGEINEELITDREIFRFEKKQVRLSTIWAAICDHETPEEESYTEFCEDFCFDAEKDVSEYRDDEDCVACLISDGMLTRKMGVDWRFEHGDDDEAEQLRSAFYDTAEKYGFMWNEYDWYCHMLYDRESYVTRLLSFPQDEDDSMEV